VFLPAPLGLALSFTFSKPSWWLWPAFALTALKLWLTGGQTIFGIGPALHDDHLFLDLAGHVINGEWLGPYTQMTLAKGPLFSVFVAAVFWIGLPLLLAQQLLYVVSCAAVTRALGPWLQSGTARLLAYSALLWNPMSYEGANLGRIMRQNLYTPLALLVLAGLIGMYSRRTENWRRQFGWAALAGIAWGCFWLTREESVWLVPGVILLLLAYLLGPGVGSFRARWPDAWRTAAILSAAASLPIFIVSTVNYGHYGWFGTVEFRAAAFKDAYGALTRIKVGPDLPMVPVTRQMREAAYNVSPTFAELQPYLEGELGLHWADKENFAPEERQIRGGWFIWALRDAVAAAGHAHNAREALQFYRHMADELNAACDAGRVPARPPRSGFLPALQTSLLGPLWDAGCAYTRFFATFESFTAYSRESLGDYAELKVFRDFVGGPLSVAPRSPMPPVPRQDELRQRQVHLLDQIGRNLSTLFSWLVPLAACVGTIRLAMAIVRRRWSFPLVLATACAGSCLAYIAINAIIEVTSFPNKTPAALASAYPLLILAIIAVALDILPGQRKI
jgi:hypothetical protein